jgi:hypothetical protein
VCPLFNELILGWELGSTHIANRLLKLMSTKCRMLSAQPCCPYSLINSLSCHMLPTLADYQLQVDEVMVPSLFDSGERNGGGGTISWPTRPNDQGQEAYNQGGLKIILRQIL